MSKQQSKTSHRKTRKQTQAQAVRALLRKIQPQIVAHQIACWAY
jgi:hypothetical protein